MIKRTYFYKVESLPLLRKQRRKEGLVTMVVGTVSFRAWRFDYDSLIYQIKMSATKDVDGLNIDDVVITSLSKV